MQLLAHAYKKLQKISCCWDSTMLTYLTPNFNALPKEKHSDISLRIPRGITLSDLPIYCRRTSRWESQSGLRSPLEVK